MNNTFYFQHDYNSHNDIKLLFVRQKLGMEGYGIYWYIIEQLAISGGKMPIKIIPVLSMQMQATEAKVEAIIMNFDLFEIIDSEFFSNRLLSQIQFRLTLSENGKKGAANRWGSGHENYDRKKALKAAQKIENHTQSEWVEMLEFFNYSCVKCGENGVIKDHIVPLYKGGLDGIRNIQPLCKKCNSSKGSDTTDYRVNHENCPENWLKNTLATGHASGGATAKERKGKESKGKESIDIRKQEFASTLKIFLEKYGKDMLNDFYKYWTEPNKSNTKFRFELEKTWSLDRRLETWSKNEKKFNNGTNQKFTTRRTGQEQLAAMLRMDAVERKAEGLRPHPENEG